MQIDITGRHVNVTPAIREFTAEKLSKLERLLDGPIEAHVVIGVEKHRHTAEIQIKARNGIFAGHQATQDLFASIGDVADKLERQAQKHKEKLQTHKHRRGHREPEIQATIAANAAPVEEAPAEPPQRPGITNGRFCAKPMTLEDALLELEQSLEPLLMFRQSDRGNIAAVARMEDGSMHVVELPEGHGE